MKVDIVVTIFLCIFVIDDNLAYPNDVATAFKYSKLVPDVTPCAPDNELQVGYPYAKFVYLGKILTPAEIVQTPGIQFLANASKYYTLAMVDPDSRLPNNKTCTFRHWLVGNIPGDEVYAGDTLAEYLKPSPPPGSGVHRYAFLAYEQAGYIKFNEPKLGPTVSQERFAPLQEFVKKYKLGCPDFGNFFVSSTMPSSNSSKQCVNKTAI